MAGTAFLAPSWVQGAQAASNTLETMSGLQNRERLTDASVQRSEASAKRTLADIGRVDALIEAQELENDIRGDERKRFLDEQAAGLRGDLMTLEAEGGAIQAAQSEDMRALFEEGLSPEGRASVIRLREEGDRLEAMEDEKFSVIESLSNLVDDPNARLRDSSREAIQSLIEQGLEWDPNNPEVGMSPQEVQDRASFLRDRDEPYFNSLDQRDHNISAYRAMFAPDGAAMNDETATGLMLAQIPGGDFDKAVEMGMLGHPVYGRVLKSAQTQAAREATQRAEYGIAEKVIGLMGTLGIDGSDPEAAAQLRAAVMEATRGVMNGDVPRGTGGATVTPGGTSVVPKLVSPDAAAA